MLTYTNGSFSRQLYSPLACELCAEVFTVPAAWVRHVQNHARDNHHHPRRRKHRSAVSTGPARPTAGGLWVQYSIARYHDIYDFYVR